MTGTIGSQPSTEFGTAPGANHYRFDCPLSQTLETSIRRTRKDVAVEEPKGRGACDLALYACSNTLCESRFVIPDVVR